MDEDEDTIIQMRKIETLPWIEKYRPKILEDILSHDEIIATIKTFIKNRCLPHLLLYGPPGTGKSSMIMACAKELYDEYLPFMVMELNASDDRGIEIVRTKIKQFVTAKNVFFGKNENDRENIFKLVILDETDAMTTDAQAILRKVVEEYTENTRFCLICNYIQNISPALQSRCTRFRFSPINASQMKKKILQIVKNENVKITDSGIDTLVKRSNGDMRRVINNLQSTSMAYKIVNEKNINTYLGYPRLEHTDIIIDALINKNFKSAYQIINSLKKQNGITIIDIISELHEILIDSILNGTTRNVNINKLNLQNVLYILDNMRTIEFNQSISTEEEIQLSGLIGIFKTSF